MTDAGIETYYEQNQYRFENPERVKVRHILVSTLDKPAEQAAEALQKAEGLLEQLRSGADFAELAKEHSEDPGNAQNGGDLGWVARGMMDPAFEAASFALQTGGLSDAPVKSDFGYHLIRLDDRENASVKPLSEVREVIRGDLIAERTQEARFELIDRALADAQGAGGALSGVAAELGLPYQEFQPFSRDDLPDDLPSPGTLLRAVFDEPAGEVFSVADAETLYIGYVAQVVPARDAEYDEVSGPVRDDYLDTESANLARQRAETLAQQARESSNDLAAAARRAGYTTRQSEFVTRDGEIEGVGRVSVLGPDAFAKTAGEVQGPVAAGSQWIVFRPLELRSADAAGLAAQGPELRKELLQRKREQYFDLFRQQKLREYAQTGALIRYGDRIQSYLRSMQSVI